MVIGVTGVGVLAAGTAVATGGPTPPAAAQEVQAQSVPAGAVYPFGAAAHIGPSPATVLAARTVAITTTPDGKGYWLTGSDGGVFAYGDAGFHGSPGGTRLAEPVVGMAATNSGDGYWLVASDGGIFNYGDAGFHGSAGGIRLAQPIVGMAATPDGNGYWLVASDGGVFTYGDAAFEGSAGGLSLAAPIVGMAATADGKGYWLFAADGGVFAYGDARYLGSAGGTRLPAPIVAVAATADRGGYWMVGRTGRVMAFGDATYYGSPTNLAATEPVVGIAPAAGGYWVAQRGDYSTPFDPYLVRYLQSLPETITAAVEDLNTGVYYYYDPGPSLILGSTVKLQILGTLLSQAQAAHRWLTQSEIQLATAMIEVSDNQAGQALFDEVGGAPAVEAWSRSVGMTDSPVYADWAVSTSTAADELTLLKVYSAPNWYLGQTYRQFGLYLLGHVERSQVFGVDTGPPYSGVLAAKTGRMPGFGVSNSVGWIEAQGRDYVIAVLTQNGPSDQSDQAAEDAVSQQAWNILGP